MFLAPLLNAAHQDLHARFIATVSLFNAGLAEPAFTTWQVIVSLIFALSVIGSYMALANEKYQLLIRCLVISLIPIVFTYKSANFYYMKEIKSSNYNSLTTQLIAKAFEFDWLPLLQENKVKELKNSILTWILHFLALVLLAPPLIMA